MPTDELCTSIVRQHAYHPSTVFSWITSPPADTIVDPSYYHLRSSPRIKRFHAFAKSPKCVRCGIEGNVVFGERFVNDVTTNHLNFYHIGPTGMVMMTVDHILPDSLGGRYGGGNFQVMCSKCNTKKHNNMSLREIEMVRQNYQSYAKAWVDERVLHLVLTLQEMAYFAHEPKHIERFRQLSHATSRSATAGAKPAFLDRLLRETELKVDKMLIGEIKHTLPPSLRQFLGDYTAHHWLNLRFVAHRMKRWVVSS